MSLLYSDLPTRSYTLYQFVKSAHDLWDDDQEAFNTFVLTGEAPGVDTQVFIDAMRNVLKADHPIQMRRDFDSLIGITNNIVIDTALSVYPVSNPSEVLSTSVHLKYKIPSNDGSTFVHTAIHQIPNFAFGYWGNRSMIHIFFPALVRQRQVRTHLTEVQKKVFYESGLRPAIEFLLPEVASEWPASYDQECFRIRKSSGHRAYGTKMVPSQAIPFLSDVLREMLKANDISWTEDFFLTHTIRGVKHAYQHDVTEDSSNDALEKLLTSSNIPYAALREGKWWIDVGLEVISGLDDCLQWATLSHSHMVREVLQIPGHKASSITTLGSSRYSRDLSSHLTGVSGCRIEPRSAGGDLGAVYFQLYTTEKATTYNPERGHHGKAITTKDVMSPPRFPIPFIEGLAKSYCDSAEKTASNARVEVRVPISKANLVFQEVEPDIIRQSLLSFKKSTWWFFRYWRLKAMSNLLTKQFNGPSTFRVNTDALLLTVALVWLINGIHSRPDDGSAARSLMRAVLPVTFNVDGMDERNLMFTQIERGVDESDDEDSLPYNPFGIIFLRRIKVSTPVPRMKIGGPRISSSAFQYFFQATEADIRHKYYSARIVERGGIARRRVPNKTMFTRAIEANPEEPQESIFDLASQGHALPPPPVDSGSDNEVAEHSAQDDNNNSGRIDEVVTTLWLQFLVDVVMKSPNGRSASAQSYLKLDSEERKRVGEELYNNATLSDMWTCVLYKCGTDSDFDLAFSHLFPIPEHETAASSQNYRQCRYYIKWKEICSTVERDTIVAIRTEIRGRYDGLKWVPYACSDRMWSTDARKPKGFTRLPLGSTGPAPRILIWVSPLWVLE